MSDRETRRYEMGGCVQTFGKDNTADLTPRACARPTPPPAPPK